MFLLSKPTAHLADFFVQTPLTFLGTTCELSAARYSLRSKRSIL